MITCKAISKNYGQEEVIKEFSFSFPESAITIKNPSEDGNFMPYELSSPKVYLRLKRD